MTSGTPMIDLKKLCICGHSPHIGRCGVLMGTATDVGCRCRRAFDGALPQCDSIQAWGSREPKVNAEIFNDWVVEENVRCVVCPTCAFTFAADHTDVPGGGYSCPLCAPVPSGEVETPCATCGGNRKVWTGALNDFLEFGTQMPCPDCGVETPEAAVEAGAKIYAFWRQRLDPNDVPPYWMTGPLAASIRNAREFLPAVYRAWRADLIAQGWTPPGTEDAK